MAAYWNRIVSHSRRVLVDRRHCDVAELLNRYAVSRDEAAFELIVERHSSLVWGVCRRTLSNPADCEDVFQATFLALVRQIQTIDTTKPLAPWLYSVALRASRKAAARDTRRRTQPLPDDCASEPRDTIANRELCRTIHEEVARLPQALREVVVACCIQGESREEAANAIGCTEAAVKSRLERARERLRTALTRRGIDLPAALVMLFIGSERASAELVEKTIGLSNGTIPLAVAALAKTGLSLATIGSLAATVGLICIATIVGTTLRPEQVAHAQPPVAEAKPAPKPAEHVDRYGDPLPTDAVRRFGTVRLRQANPHFVQFTPEGKTLVAGSSGYTLGVFEAATGRKLRDIGERAINGPAEFRLTPDGKQVLCLGYNVTLWDFATGELVQRYKIGRCESLAMAPDGKSFVCQLLQDPVIQHVELSTGRILAEKKFPVEAMHESRFEFDDSGRVVTMQIMTLKKVKDGQYHVDREPLQLWDTAANSLANGPIPGVEVPNDFASIPGTKSIAYAIKKGPIVIWDTENQKVVRNITPTENDTVVTKLMASADGKRIAARTKSTIEVLEIATGKSVFKLDIGPGRSIYRKMNLSADGKQLACVSDVESIVRVWNVDTGKELLADSGHSTKPKFVLSPDGSNLTSTTFDEEYRWDLKTGQGVRKPQPKADQPAITIDQTNKGKLWDYTIDEVKNCLAIKDKTGTEIAACKIPDESSRGQVISDDGRHFAISFQDRKHTVLIWTPLERKEPFVITGHRDACQHLLFSHDGKTLFAGAGTHNNYNVNVLHLYDVATGKSIHTLKSNGSPGHSCFTKDDRTLITGGLWNDATCRVWNIATGEQTATLIDPTLRLTTETDTPKALASIEGIEFSPDERLLAVMSGIDDQSSIAVWEVGTWKLVKSFAPFHPRAHYATMRFSKDGRSLFVANPDTTILEWDLSGRFGTSNAQKLSQKRLDELALKIADREGYSAIWELIDHPEQAIALFRGPLKPAAKPTAEQLEKWIASLDAEAFRERDDAQRKLLSQGDAALPALEIALKAASTAEARERIETIVGQLREGKSPLQLRNRRLIAILDLIGDEASRKLLSEYAKGDPRDRLTQDAKKAVAIRN